jgi:hypothetical protein
MPVDREDWFKQLDLSNFVNTFYQYRDVTMCAPAGRVLIIGPGQGLSSVVLRWRSYRVTTLDIDQTFKPDYVGSIHDMNMFSTGEFDVAIASHVLEHLAEPYLDRSLHELARVARYALVYLPVSGRHAQVRVIPGFKGLDFSAVIDVFNPLIRPDGITARFCQRQHFWEVGLRGFRLKQVIARMSVDFEIIKTYRNRDWLPSRNFVLRSRLCVQSGTRPLHEPNR